MFIASLLYRGQMRDGPAHDTRDGAARALFALYPRAKSCSTANAYQDGAGVWRTIGSDSRDISRASLDARQ